MVTPELYRASATRTQLAALADNEQWLAGHRDQSVPATGAGAANEAAPVSIGDAAAAVQQ